jgi:hypothetical protein
MVAKTPSTKAQKTHSVRVRWLGEDIGLAQELVPFFRDRGMNLELSVAESSDTTVPADIALAYVPDPAGAGGVLHPGSSLRTVVWPPLVAIVARNPSRGDLEKMRRQGVVHVCREVDATFGNVVRRLVEPATCGRWSLQPGLLAEALASAEKASASGMLCVSCSHWDGVSTYPWENSSLFYCSEPEGGKCSGWAGRIYLVGGAITLAETPLARGAHALQQMMSLTSGAIMRFPFYLSPETTDPLGPISTAMLRPTETTETAAQVNQLVEREPALELRRPTRPERGVAPPLAPHLPGKDKDRSVTDLDAVLASSPAFSGAVRVGNDGNPQAAVGDVDAPLLSAVAYMGLEQAQGVAAALPLGSVIGVSVSGRSGACFVRHSAKLRSTLVVRSGSTQTPNRTLAELSRFG